MLPAGNLAMVQQKVYTNAAATMNIAIIFLTFNSILNFSFNYIYSFFIVATAVILIIFTHLFFTKSRPLLSRYMLVLVSLAAIVGLNITEGLIAGNYLYILVFLIMANFLFSYQEKKHIIIVYCCIFISLLIIFTLSPIHSQLQKMNSRDELINFSINLSASFIFTSIFSYRLIRRNHNNIIAAEQQGQFLHTIYNSSLDAVFVIDGTTDCITDCNQNSLQLFEIKNNKQIIDQPMHLLFAAPFNSNTVHPELYMPDKPWQGEADCITTTGKVFAGYVSVVPFMNNSVIFKKISILDISDIRQVQNQLIVAKEKAEDAARAKSRFLSNMSHELRTPLNGIIGSANLLLLEEGLPEKLSAHSALLKYSSEHMLGLVNDVLDFSKIEAGKMELDETAFEPKRFIHHLYEMFKPQFDDKKLQFWYELDEELADITLMGDTVRIRQVLSNILSNACKFTMQGQVVLRVRLQDTNADACTLYFEVADTGPGVSAGKQEVIFESFGQADTATTRKFGGTGLGLAISKRIVEMYEGELQVKDNIGRGSCFYFTLTLRKNADITATVKVINNESLAALNGLRLLIAEDNAVNMMIAVRFLEKWGIQPVQAKNGKEALQQFNPGSFDILLVDLEMPEMDGYELVAAVKKKDAHVPVIAFTAALYENMVADLLAKGFSDYLQKPFRPADLHHKVAFHTQRLPISEA